jgi:hypothetical protein
MARKKVVHYGIRGAFCGEHYLRVSYLTAVGPQVTCTRCRKSSTFRVTYPDLAAQLPSNLGRPKAIGVKRTFKVYMPEDLSDWVGLNQQTAASLVVRGLKMVRELEQLPGKGD